MDVVDFIDSVSSPSFDSSIEKWPLDFRFLVRLNFLGLISPPGALSKGASFEGAELEESVSISDGEVDLGGFPSGRASPDSEILRRFLK